MKTLLSSSRTLLTLLIASQALTLNAEIDQTPGPEFQVNTYSTLGQYSPEVGSSSSGDFVVVWSSRGAPDSPGSAILGQRFSSAGDFVGSEFRVSETTTQEVDYPAISVGPSGNFVVTWLERVSLDQKVVATRRFPSSGPSGPVVFPSGSSSYLEFPKLALAPDGGYLVVWGNPDGGTGGDD